MNSHTLYVGDTGTLLRQPSDVFEPVGDGRSRWRITLGGKMPTTIQLSSAYKINVGGGGNHPMTPAHEINADLGGPFTLDLGADGLLVPGDSVTVTGPNGSLTGIYLGLTSLNGGDPVIDFGGSVGVGIFSNNAYSNGTPAGQLVIEDFISCFLAGTRIASPMGEVRVETLAVGDSVLTADGRCVPVKWIGRQTCSLRFGIPEGRRPLSIAAGALGDNLPVRDLRLTADHALLIDNVLVQVGALVNGTTVRRIAPSELGERFVVYHIETENHEIVLAEGMPAETFIDNISRRRFDNYAEYEALYGDETAIVELDRPRAMSARQVPRAIRERLATVARQLTPAAAA